MPAVASLRRFGLLAALAAVPSVCLASLPPGVLAKSQWTELTRADYDKALERVPEKRRFEFATSPKRVQDVLNQILLTKTLAAQARAHGTALAGAFGAGSAPNDADKALADAELARVEADARKWFDEHESSFEAKAREIYDVDKDDYRTPEEIRLSDIAVLVKGRGDEAARQRAAEARAKIAAGTDVATVAREYSDDPTTRDKGGALPFKSARGLSPSFAKALFALQTIGEVSPPIKGPTAWHVVRLEERKPSVRKPFDDVRDEIMTSLRERYVKDRRDARIQAVFRDPSLETNQAAIDALVNHVDPEMFKVKPAAPAPK
jgi:hypothetical protein